MNNIYKAVIRTKTSYLVHYNHNHDKLGRFAKSNGASSSPAIEKYKKDQETYKQERDEAWNDRKTNPDGFREKMAKAQNKLGEAYKKLKESQDRKAKEYADYVSGIDRDEGKRSPDEDLREEAKIAGNIAKEEKDIIPVKFKSIDSIVGEAKLSKDQHKCSAFDGDVTIYGWTGNSMVGPSIDVSGKSATKRYRIEKKSKDGVHLMESYKTGITFDDVGNENATAIDRKKLKELNDYSTSKESRKSLDAGKKLVSTDKLDMYKSWSSDPISRKLPEKYNSDNFYRDLYPSEIVYEKNKKTNKPEIRQVYFVDKYDNLAGHVICVDYEDGKPKRSSLEG